MKCQNCSRSCPSVRCRRRTFLSERISAQIVRLERRRPLPPPPHPPTPPHPHFSSICLTPGRLSSAPQHAPAVCGNLNPALCFGTIGPWMKRRNDGARGGGAVQYQFLSDSSLRRRDESGVNKLHTTHRCSPSRCNCFIQREAVSQRCVCITAS